jgi:hypothetical protein
VLRLACPLELPSRVSQRKKGRAPAPALTDDARRVDEKLLLGNAQVTEGQGDQDAVTCFGGSTASVGLGTGEGSG